MSPADKQVRRALALTDQARLLLLAVEREVRCLEGKGALSVRSANTQALTLVRSLWYRLERVHIRAAALERGKSVSVRRVPRR